ncbi:MAG: hypothetical protein JOZ62_08665 [Acidobacteriaceae bacterium]|nr:hypothetical protein [Acidobacteriaceae bacterium]
MSGHSSNHDVNKLVGSLLDGLSLADRRTLTGFWIAIELYSPDRLPLRKIEAVGADPSKCIEQLRTRGLNPARFEFELITDPNES